MGSKNGLSGNRTTRKGAMCQWHMFSTDRSGSGEALAKQQPVRTWESGWRKPERKSC